MRNRNVTIVCHSCKKKLIAEIPIGFKAICDYCSEYLHACVQCRHFDLIKNRCNAQVEEKPKDTRSHNFCDEYSVRESNNENVSDQVQGSNAINQLEGLFKKNLGDIAESKKKKSINDLFKD